VDASEPEAMILRFYAFNPSSLGRWTYFLDRMDLEKSGRFSDISASSENWGTAIRQQAPAAKRA
jgi:hypothetical protein